MELLCYWRREGRETPSFFAQLVVSNQVVEHVQDHALALGELSRVLKPGAISLHFFRRPGFRGCAYWLALPRFVQRVGSIAWARLRISSEFQRELSSRQ